MIQTFLFDYGAVLGSDVSVFPESEKMILKTGLKKDELMNIYMKSWDMLKVGKKDLDDYCSDVIKHSKKNISKNDLLDIHFSEIRINQPLLNFVKTLKEKEYNVYILSNESKEGMKQKIKKFNLSSIFSHIYCSAQIGFAKPDEKIFEYVINDLRTAPETMCVIDDWDKNIETAKHLGMHGIIYQNLEKLKKEIENIT